MEEAFGKYIERSLTSIGEDPSNFDCQSVNVQTMWVQSSRYYLRLYDKTKPPPEFEKIIYELRVHLIKLGFAQPNKQIMKAAFVYTAKMLHE